MTGSAGYSDNANESPAIISISSVDSRFVDLIAAINSQISLLPSDQTFPSGSNVSDDDSGSDVENPLLPRSATDENGFIKLLKKLDNSRRKVQCWIANSCQPDDTPKFNWVSPGGVVCLSNIAVSLLLQAFSLATLSGFTSCGDKSTRNKSSGVVSDDFETFYNLTLFISALIAAPSSALEGDKIVKTAGYASGGPHADIRYSFSPSIRKSTIVVRWSAFTLVLGSLASISNVFSRLGVRGYPPNQPTMDCYKAGWDEYLQTNVYHNYGARLILFTFAALVLYLPQKICFYISTITPPLGIIVTAFCYTGAKAIATLSVHVIVGKKLTCASIITLLCLTWQRFLVYTESNRLVNIKVSLKEDHEHPLNKLALLADLISGKHKEIGDDVRKLTAGYINEQFSCDRWDVSSSAQMLLQVFSFVASLCYFYWCCGNLNDISSNIGFESKVVKCILYFIAFIASAGKDGRFCSSTTWADQPVHVFNIDFLKNYIAVLNKMQSACSQLSGLDAQTIATINTELGSIKPEAMLIVPKGGCKGYFQSAYKKPNVQAASSQSFFRCCA